MVVDIRPARYADIEPFCRVIRPGDVAEIAASSGVLPADEIRRAMGMSPRAWTATLDGEPAAMLGVGSVSMLADHGKVWMHGSVLMDRARRRVALATRDHLPEVRRGWRTIGNWVDARYSLSIRWLRWLGFEIGEQQFYGVLRLPFLPFRMDGL